MTKLLNSEINTQRMEKRIRHAFLEFLRANRSGWLRNPRDFFFEHGQWWARVLGDADVTFSVVDAEPGYSGFDFEEV